MNDSTYAWIIDKDPDKTRARRCASEEVRTMTVRTDVGTLASDLWLDAVVNGGGTRNLADGGTPPFGYVVGRPPFGDILPDLSKVDQHEHIAKWLRGLPNDARYVGIWLDTDTGSIHLDVVDLYDARHMAHGASVRRGELAYYSLHEAKEYRLDGGH